MAKKFVLFVVAVLVISLALMPKLAGHFFETKYKSLIAQVNAQQDKIQIKIMKYDAGWFTSDAVLEVVPTKESVQPTDVIFTSMPTVTFHQTVYHGPLIISPSGVHLGMAEVDGSADMERGSFRTVADFSDNWKTRIDVPAAKFNLGPIKVDWQGLGVTMHTVVNKNEIKAFDMNLNFGGFTAFPDSSTQIVVQPVSVVTQTKADPIGVWVGKNSILMPGIQVLTQDTVLFKLDSLTQAYTFGIDYAKHYNSKFTLDLKNVNTIIPPADAFMPVSELLITASTADLDAEAIAQVAKKAGVFANPTKAEMSEYAKSVLTPTTTLAFNAYMKSKLGDFTGDFKMFPKGVPVNAEDTIDKADFDINIRVAGPLLEEIVKQAMPLIKAYMKPAAPAMGPGPVLPPGSEPAAEAAKPAPVMAPSDPQATPTMWIGQWEKEGLILKSGDDYTFVFKKDAEGMTMNGKPFGE